MTWRLIRTDDKLLQLAQLVLLCVAVTRGLDYLITPAGSSAALSYIEQSAPLPVWGALFIAFGMTGLAGEWWMSFGESDRRWIASWTAHAGLAALYFTFAIGALLELFSREPFYGFRTACDWAILGFLHVVFIRRRDRV